MKFVVCLSLLVAGFSYGAQAEGFSIETYKKECGDAARVIYPSCDDPNGTNQATIYADAIAYGKEKNKPVLVIFGADWCPPCRIQEVDMKNKSDLKDVLKNYVIVKIKVDSDTAKDLVDKHDVFAAPTSFIFDPKAEETLSFEYQGETLENLLGYDYDAFLSFLQQGVQKFK